MLDDGQGLLRTYEFYSSKLTGPQQLYTMSKQVYFE